MFAASCAIANRTRRKRRKESPQSVVSFLQKMSLSGKPRNRSRSPVKRSGDRLYHSGEKDDRRNSKEKHISKESRNDEIRTPKMDAKPKPPNVSVKTEKHESRVSSIESKESRTNHNSTPRQSHSSSHSRTYTNPVTGKIERKFSNRCRLFIGNIIDITEEEFKKMFDKYGEYSEAYINKEKSFGFIKMDTRMNAEAAKNALDGSSRRGRTLVVRFASKSAALHVSNLGPLVSNEMLVKAFSTFGDVERAVVVVDDRGRSKGYGVVEFARKSSAINAMQRTNEGFFMIGRSPRPVFVKQQEQTDEEEGLLEKSIERQQGYYKERDTGACFAAPGTFEYEWCQKWKALDEMRRSKKEMLEKQFLDAAEKLEADMSQAVLDYESEISRRELMAQQEQLRRQEEMMRQELLRQQALEIRRHEEVRIQEELRRQDEIRMQEEVLFRRREEIIRRRQQEEAALLHSGRLPQLPQFAVGPGIIQPGLLGQAVSPLHTLPPRLPGPLVRGLPPQGEPRHAVTVFDVEAERARERALERADRVRSSGRYHDHHAPRDRYADNRNSR